MTPSPSFMLLRAFCDELARCGLSDACTSPGSRCAPIVLSLVREERIRCWSHIDERAAGFFALGAAKASGRPVAVTCTSGTAAANLAPAVHEAYQARVPLILLTADRPPELRDVGAGQTIDQLKLFGDAAKWFIELDLNDSSTERLRWIRTIACRSYWTALAGTPGPVHLNFPLREPLVPDGPFSDDPTGRDDGAPWVRLDSPPRAAVFREAPHRFERAVIVAGRDDAEPELGAALAATAARAGIPLLADPLSGARRGEAAIAHYDLLLREPRFLSEHRPQLVLRFGDLPTSKPLRAWLASLEGVAQIAVGPAAAWRDPDSVVGMQIDVAPKSLVEEADMRGDDRAWLQSWRSADAAATTAIQQVLGDQALTEPLLAARIGEWLPSEATLFVASSMPVRDVEAFFPVRDRPPRIVSNRGANGIDGTISSAFGVAAVSEAPTVLLIGDVALAHDLGGLLAARRLGLALTIVVVNNEGGGIFHFLPISGEEDVFEAHIATPHGLQLADVARAFGLHHRVVASTDALRAALPDSLGAQTTTLLEVPSDRRQNLLIHRRLSAAVSESLRQAPEAFAG